MDIQTKRSSKAMKYLGWFLFLFSFLQFSLYYFPLYTYESHESDILLLIATYFIDFFEMLFPVITALVISLTRPSGIKNKLIVTFAISLTRLSYSFPYFYIYFVSDVWDSIESVAFSLLASPAYIIGFFLQVLICVAIINFSEKKSESPVREKSPVFDFENRTNFGIAISTLFIFMIFFVRELIETVFFLIDYSSTIKLEEILYIVFCYVILIIFAIIIYSISASVKNAVVKKASE